MIQRANQGLESLAAIRDLLGFTESFSNLLVGVDTHVQVCLEHILRLSNQEKSNLLGNSVADISQNDRKVGIDLLSQVSNENILVTAWNVEILLLWLLWEGFTLGIILWGQLSFVLSSKLLNLRAVSEVVVELGVDDSFYKSACVIS